MRIGIVPSGADMIVMIVIDSLKDGLHIRSTMMPALVLWAQKLTIRYVKYFFFSADW